MDINKFEEIFERVAIIDNKLVIKEELLKTISFIKENYNFKFLKSITANDNVDNIELIYHLYNIEDEEDLLVSVFVNNEAESVSEIFDSAVADEKEIFDMFGIRFVGNKELKRLYMPESWEGNPLKKDYIENDERLNWND